MTADSRATVPLRLLLLVLVGCAPPSDPTTDSAVLVAERILPEAIEGRTAYLSPRWQIPVEGGLEPVPGPTLDALRTATGLPVLPDSLQDARVPDVAVLYLFRPRVHRPDSVEVVAGWMSLVGGDGGTGWGREWAYLVDCSDGCRVVDLVGGGPWN